MESAIYVVERPNGKIDVRTPVDGKTPEQICEGLAFFVLPSSAVPLDDKYRSGWILSDDKTKILEGIFAYDECGTIMAWVPV